jgi:hypothetical protein
MLALQLPNAVYSVVCGTVPRRRWQSENIPILLPPDPRFMASGRDKV